MNEWQGFKGTKWQKNIDVQDFIESNYKEYLDDDSFLKGISYRTEKVWGKCKKLLAREAISGVLDVETFIMSGIDNFEPGYIDRKNEVIVGLQTDEPLKRIVNPYGGYRMVKKSLEAYGFHLEKELEENFKEFRKTHNDGVFDAYTDEIKKARHNHLITGLPDAYGRGRIIGDYRRLALYGADFLIEKKKEDLSKLTEINDVSTIQLREDVKEQIKALELIKKMCSRYGFDVSKPASNAKEAIQWTYFAYLAAVKQNNGAATSIGRNTTFFDIYIERDIEKGILTEEYAQELIDQFVIKLRLVRHLRTPEYNELFAGDPTWVTESIGGMLDDEKSLVTKTAYRMLNSLNNIGESAEPNLTVLWSKKLPENFKKFASKMSIKTHTLQFENDDIMRPLYGNDYAISCCVSALKLGYQTQFFGARINFVKVLLYALNGGRDEITGDLVIEGIDELEGEYLDADQVLKQFDKVLKKTVKIYVDALNIIHYMHDKYAYESSQMAFLNTELEYLMAFGLAGISIVTDSFSAIQYGHVRVKRDERGLTNAFDIEFDYPRYGNNDDNVDAIAKNLVKRVYRELKRYPLYKNAIPTLSLLTITSNVVYGKHTGATPDGRKEGVPFSPGANPTQGADKNGALASLSSVAKIPYKDCCQDGVSNTFSIIPTALGSEEESRINNLVKILDGYFNSGAHHLNVNVLDKDLLVDAMNNPNKYPNLTIRVSGYAVNFNKLTKEQKEEVISRTFHERV
ncbi:MAG: formate C-acetyltransferase [Firmicutes bacterium]|nr:formate C-acetyltransferase [Bacillota bacterium]